MTLLIHSGSEARVISFGCLHSHCLSHRHQFELLELLSPSKAALRRVVGLGTFIFGILSARRPSLFMNCVARLTD